jgi:hypothetical protein
VALSELALTGLKDDSTKTLSGRAFECPNCGNALEVKLATTQSITCGQCSTVVDVSAGVGADMAHYQQANAGVAGAEPQIPLGSTGKLALGVGAVGALLPWQVVGYAERCDIPESSEDETSFWREYLLFNQLEGFAFLVDSNDGWSWVRPITGVPAVRGDKAQWQDRSYAKKWAYGAKITWVQGEFYWRVKRDERAHVIDYEGIGAHSKARLSREQAGNEVTWSAGETLAAATVADAFGIAAGSRAAMQRDVAPVNFGASGATKALLIFFVVVVLMIMLTQCNSSSNDCADVRSTFGEASTEYQQCQRNRSSGGVRTGGGSYGGWSSGSGGHK